MSDKGERQIIRRKSHVPWQGPHVTSALVTIVTDGIGLLFASLSLANKQPNTSMCGNTMFSICLPIEGSLHSSISGCSFIIRRGTRKILWTGLERK